MKSDSIVTALLERGVLVQVGWLLCTTGEWMAVDDERHGGRCPDCTPVYKAKGDTMAGSDTTRTVDDDAEVTMSHIAQAIEEAMGDPVNSQEGAPQRGPWLPLSVRYAAAEAAAKVVTKWRAANEPSAVGLPDAELDAAIRAACIPNMRKAFAGEPITAEDIAAEQGALDIIRAKAEGDGREHSSAR